MQETRNGFRRWRLPVVLLLAFSLSACLPRRWIAQDVPKTEFRLNRNAKLYGCTHDEYIYYWKPEPQCLLLLPAELANPPQFPIGTPIHVLEIRNCYGWSCRQFEIGNRALVRIGRKSNSFDVFVFWPSFMKALDPVDKDGS